MKINVCTLKIKLSEVHLIHIISLFGLNVLFVVDDGYDYIKANNNRTQI